MPRYRLRLTRDVTESVDVEVNVLARSLAINAALELARTKPETLEWALDDGNDSRPYVADPDDIERI